jgi:carbon dioxide concentrating mechanism protein CcmO
MIDSLGLVEVIGFVSTIEAVDVISKDANVTVLGKEGIGGGLVTVIVRGKVDDVKMAVDMGSSASKKVGQLSAAHVIARPHPSIFDLIKPDADQKKEIVTAGSLGFIEVKGLVPAIQAADTALKSAGIVLLGRHNVGMGLISVMFSGDIGAVRTAVETAAAAAEKIGEVFSVHVIPKPHHGTYPIAMEPTL